MNGSEYGSLLLLLYAVIVGAMLGVLWDVFRVIRIAFYGRRTGSPPPVRLPSDSAGVERALRFKHNIKIPSLSFFGTFICDLLFCLICTICVILLLFHLNDGEVRMFALLGAMIGFVVYYLTLGRLTVYFSDIIIRTIKKAVLTILRYTIFPILRICAAGVSRVKRSIRRKRRRKLTQKYMKKTVKNAKQGFDIQF